MDVALPPVFDAHLHVVDPAFPLVPNDGYLPPAFTVADYRTAVAGLEVVGGAVVSGSFQAFDTTYLVDAIGRLGPGFVGVVNLRPDVADEEIVRLDAAGVRAVRVNLYRGGSAGAADLDRLARRVHEVAGWHTELYVDAAELPDLAPTLLALPRVSFDHLGMTDDPTGTLLRFVEAGHVVKATGLGRVDVTDPAALVARILRANPQGLVFGTDLPSTRARRPYTHDDAVRVAQWSGELAADVLAADAQRLYLRR